ncbi:MAG TPA: hypothetical protein PLR25_11465, partial [Planctomycetaceae bacterium]|nr:hypothetical protein [Planctomycetaceae bacterium]
MSASPVGSLDAVLGPPGDVTASRELGPAPTVSVSDEAATAQRALLLGLAAAATYSVANLALRGLSRPEGGTGWDMWVAGTKAFPTFLIAVILLAVRRFR